MLGNECKTELVPSALAPGPVEYCQAMASVPVATRKESLTATLWTSQVHKVQSPSAKHHKVLISPYDTCPQPNTQSPSALKRQRFFFSCFKIKKKEEKKKKCGPYLRPEWVRLIKVAQLCFWKALSSFKL